MNQKKKIIRIYRHIQKCNYKKAIIIVHSILAKEQKRLFWIWYLGTICYIYLDELQHAQEYLNKAKELSHKNSYVLLIQAYLHTINQNTSKAIYIWIDLINQDEHVIAKRLLEYTKNNTDMYLLAKENISYFFQIPEIYIIYPQTISKKSHFYFYKQIYLFILIIFGICLFGYWVFTQKNAIKKIIFMPQKVKKSNIKELQFTHANVIKNLTTKNYLFLFRNSEEIISDFNKAKDFIQSNQVNQARFLLQRILFSNADFSTKEEVKIFLKFIPKVSIKNFSDRISQVQVFENFPFYQHSQILWKTKVLKYENESQGYTFELITKEKDITYNITAFLPKNKNTKNWFYKSEYPYENERKFLKKNDAFIFGTIHSLLDKNNIYIELDNIWY